MSVRQRWVRQPQRVWLRRALLDRFFATPRPTFDAKATRLTSEQLQARAESLYPGSRVTRVGDRITRRNPTIEIWVERATEKKERLFNPYTGEDLGDSVTQGEYFVLWLARLLTNCCSIVQVGSGMASAAPSDSGCFSSC
jgi:hypothetical protein